jgi:hypothetical protein
MNKTFLLVAVYLACHLSVATAADLGKAAEESLDCAAPPDPNVQLSETAAFMRSATQTAVAKARIAVGKLTELNREKLQSAVSKEQLQTLVMEQFVHLERGTNVYSFSGPAGCALTKSYGTYRESICVQPGAAQLGLRTSRLPSNISPDELRKVATGWSLNLSCMGKKCAVYVGADRTNMKDAYLMIAHFDDEQASLLTVEGLNALAKMCSAPSKSGSP